MFRAVRLSIIRSLFTVHSAMVYVILVCRQLSSRTRMELSSCSRAVYKPVWHIPLLSVQRINSRWWTDELSETCRVSWQNKFVKMVHLFGFITKKFVTMHGHINVKFSCTVMWYPNYLQSFAVKFVFRKIDGLPAQCFTLLPSQLWHRVADC